MIDVFKYMDKNSRKNTHSIFEFLDSSLHNKVINDELWLKRKVYYEDVIWNSKENKARLLNDQNKKLKLEENYSSVSLLKPKKEKNRY